MLQLVEIAALGIAAGGLPTSNYRPRRFIELAGDLGVETKTVEPALDVTAQAFVEAELVFCDLAGFIGEGGRIGAARQIAGRGRRTVLQRGDPGERQRLELTVGIFAQISVAVPRLIGFPDRAPKFDFDVGARGTRGNGSGCRR